ncbi:hypothetical protein KIN20_026204 [Parelaphostrongylus tenuis]|uniref:Uncharacterized protein n=1 Tax=Parelaphostrongylus tenuis TaxID=148309 RepID=A0AAD5QXI7_PARTN|nr:hypothetical protein KIN20_026204 [Parelaphostrongylus tenuis]
MLDFLNAFLTRTEAAILEADQKLRSADTKLKILEAKLAMIPDPSSDVLETQTDVAKTRRHSVEAADLSKASEETASSVATKMIVENRQKCTTGQR